MNAPNVIFNALMLSSVSLFAPIKAPIKAPNTIPIGVRNNPIMVPIIVPIIAFLPPPNFLTPKICNT